MAEFKLGRIKFVYQGTWTNGQTYVVDDVVTVGGKTYICVVSHTASPAFNTDLTHNPPYWNIVADGTQWTGNWQVSHDYNAGDLALWGGVVYICKTPHHSNSSATAYPGGLEADLSKWDEFAANFNWLGSWTVGTRYKLNDLVTYGGYTYVCNQAHVSDASATNGLEQDLSKWDTFNAGIVYQGAWSGSTVRYKLNDIVKYGADLWICTTKHTSSSTFDYSKWSVFVNGFQFEDSWSNATEYQLGDIVTYGGNTYTALQGSTGQVPSTATAYWRPFTSGFDFQGDWSAATAYKIGSVVRLGGYTYLALVDNAVQTISATATTVSTDPTRPNQVTIDDSSKLVVGLPVSFAGTGFGNIVSGTTYYVSFIVDPTHIRISATQGGVDFNLTTATGTLTGTSSPKPPFTTYWTRLNSGLRWNATPATYTTVSSTTTSGPGTGAKFDVIASGTNYTVTLSAGNAGSAYTTSSILKVLGSSVGGISPANDITITITGTSGGGVSTFTSTGYSVTWVSGITYVLGDVVYFGANSYICVSAHIATSGSRPDADTTALYWNLLASGAESAVLTTQGDTFYYGTNGPTRLPIGTDGQILRVNGTIPSWQYYGQINNLVYVAPTGSDTIGNGQGTTIDKPWQSIRFACLQIEAGYLNTNAGMLLTLNKQFMMKEVNNYILKTFTVSITGSTTSEFTASSVSMLYIGMPISFSGTGGGVTVGTTYWVKNINTIANSFSISDTQTGNIKSLSSGSTVMTGTYVYSQAKAERDAGLIIEGAIFDITHNGNFKTITNANSFFSNGSLVSGVYSYDITPFVSSLNYLKSTLMTAVLANTAPATSYQALNNVSAGARAQQQINLAYTAESGISTTVQTLVSIVTSALTAGTNTALPATINPNTTISAKTGTYNEILPIVLPAFTAIVGDELRSTIVQPGKADTLLATVAPKTQSALNHIKALLPSLMNNTPVKVSTGNTTAQQYLYNTNVDTATNSITSNTTIMSNILANGLTSVPAYVYPDPTGYGSGYFNARRLVIANKAFIQAEIAAYMNATYTTLWNVTLTPAQQTACTRDIGYIVDALIYDLTYGETSGCNLATVIAARSYYSNGVFVENSGEKTAALACQTYLKSFIDNIVLATTGWGQISGGTQDRSGTPGSAGAATFAQARVQEMYDTINTGTTPTTIAPSTAWVSATLTTANTNIQSQKTALQASTIAWINSTFPDLYYNQTTCSRDVGYIVDALCYDMMFGGNFLSSWNAMSYYRAITSTQLVISNQLQATIGTVAFVGGSIKEITSGVTGTVGSTIAINSLKSSFDIIYNAVASGLGSEPVIVMSTPTGYNTSTLTNTAYATTTGSNATGDTTGYGYGVAQIRQNYAYIVAEVLAYFAAGSYSAVYTSEGTTGPSKGYRDITYILDSILYDMTYGGNTQSLVAGSSYYSISALQITTAEKPAFIDALGRLKAIITTIVQKGAVSNTAGNNLTQVTGGTAGSPAAGGFAQDRVQDVVDWISNGSGNASVAPYYGWASSKLQTAYANLTAQVSNIASDAVVWCQKYYQAVAFSSSLANRDAGLIINCAANDMVLGTNFNAIQAGRAFNRANTSATTLRNGPELPQTLGAINFMYYKAKQIAASGAVVQIQTTIDDINNYLTGGSAPAQITWAEPALPTATYTGVTGTVVSGGGNGLAAFAIIRSTNGNGYYNLVITPTTAGASYTTSSKIRILGTAIGGITPANDIILNVTQVSTGGVVAVTYSTPADAVALLEANRSFVLAEIIAYININYSSITTNSNYTVAKTQRDAAYILDAIHYDLLYGGNWASQQAGMAYYSALYGSQIATGLITAFSNTVNFISTTLQSIVVGTAIVSPQQSTVTQVLQTTSGRTGGAKDATQTAALMTIVKNFVDNGLTTGAPVVTVTTIATTDTFTANGHGLVNGDIVIPQATTNGLTSTIIGSSPVYYVVSASTNTFKLATSYGGTALTTFTNGTGLSIKLQAFAMPSLSWVSSTNIAAYSAVSGSISTYQTGATASFTATFNGTTTITVTAVASGTISNGMYVTGSGIPGGAYIIPGGNGSGSTGTYILSLATTKGTVASLVAGNTVSAVTTGVIAYLNSTYPALTYNQDYASRDTYNVTLASMLDMMLGSNFAAIQAGRAYNRTQDYQVLGYEKEATIGALNYLSTLIASTLASYATPLAKAQTSIYLTISMLQNGSGKTPEMNGTVTYNNNLGIINGAEVLRANIPFLASETVAYYATAYGGSIASLGGTATSSSATISGTTLTVGGTVAGTFGVGTVINGVGITAGTYITNVSSGGNYTVSISQTFSGSITGSTNVITTSANHNFIVNDPVVFTNTTVSTTATAVSGNNITVGTTTGMVVGEQIVFGTKPSLGGNLGNLVSGTLYYVLTIGSGVITVTATAGGSTPFAAGTDTGVVTAVAGGATGGLTMNSTYYVLGVISPTQFVVTTNEGYLNSNAGTSGTIVTASIVPSPGMTVAYQFIASKAKSDITYFLNAIVYDLQYTGNYKSLRNARVLLNAVNGSAASDMWYVRNGCGLRNMTMNGLTGTLPPTVNSFGTRRPTGGAFTSLDAGFGPNDSNAWVYSRSTYVQNCTMFGYACIGAKVDGALHAGGYRSMVANDYTCIIGDGIGWQTTGANSLSELVSVFNYYSYAGYLAELGGRIRATNGNSSYGTYGVVAEGVDTTETPIYGSLNNRNFAAQISTVVTDAANSILRFEYSNAGTNYTNAVPTISGSGYNAAATQDEFRDAAVFESRLIDTGTTTNSSVGGSNYVTVTNTAQVVAQGLPVTGFIVISATDTALSNAYRGMRIQINAGTGVGQYANILSYANGTKQANIIKETFVTLPITASSTTVFTVASTSTLYVGMPIYLNTAFAGLAVDTVYYVLSNNLTATQFSVGTQAGGSVQSLSAVSAVNLTVTATAVVNNLITATNALVAGQTVTFNSSFNGIDANTLYYVLGTNLTTSLFSVSTQPNGTAVTITATGSVSSTGAVGTAVYAAGWDHVVPGTPIINATDLTTNYQIEPRIIYSTPGYKETARSLSTTATWSAVTYGAGRYVAVSNTAGATTTSYSSNGTSWTTGGALPTDASATWNGIVYGGGQGSTATAVVGGFGGSGAVLQAVIGTGLYATQIISVNVISGGYNYSTPPTIVFTGGGGTGATATAAVLNGVIQSVTMVINGSGYSSQPTVTAATNILAGITMNNWGSNYYSTPTVTISQPQGLSPTAFALNTSVLLNAYLQTAAGRIYIVTQAGTTDAVTTPAFDYTSANYTNVSNGTAKLTYVATQAQGVPTLTNAGVSSIALSVYGYGYTTVPTVTILDTTAKFVAISSTTTKVGYATVAGLGSAWSATVSNASTNQNLKSIAYGNGYYVAVGGAAGTGTAASSSDGVTWVSRTPTALSAGYYSAVAFGNGTFIAVNNGALITSLSINSGATWTAGGSLPAGFTTAVSMTYGNGRFVVLGSDGKVAYSIDKGTTWVVAPTATGATTSILSSSYTWSAVTYFQGVFFAIAKGTTICATSHYGNDWTIRALPSSSNWQAIVGGNVTSATLGPQPLFVAVSNTSGTVAASIKHGTSTRGRMKVIQSTGIVNEVRILEPGGGYPKGNVSATTTSTNLITVDDTTNLSTSLANNQPIEFTGLDAYGLTTNVTYYVVGSSVTSTQFSVTATAGSTTTVNLTTGTGTGVYRAGPVITQVDPNKVTTAGIRVRLGDGALGNPSFPNRGTNNATATASTTGDGYGDIYQNSAYINVTGLFAIPSPGANVQFSTITGSAQWYKLVTVTNVLGNPGSYTAQFTINPALTTLLAPTHNTLITTRLKYSQVRLTGHDFLYIGTGNQTKTNYPYVDASTAIQSNQELNTGGGRTFFTSTDQDGNFNVGNLFGVQQSTGTATLNASAFNLAGLQSLTLGAVSLGVGSATITQFSTDPYFTANSDNILPTQKAIKSYITAQIGGGSSSLNVNTLTAGQIYIANNSISNTTGGQINVSSKMNFTGGIDGAPVALVFFGQR